MSTRGKINLKTVLLRISCHPKVETVKISLYLQTIQPPILEIKCTCIWSLFFAYAELNFLSQPNGKKEEHNFFKNMHIYRKLFAF